METNEPQAKFLLAALQDTLGIIRAVDAKVAALFFALSLPVTKLSSIWWICVQVKTRDHGGGGFLLDLLILIFAASWLVSFAAALRTLRHVENPAEHVDGEKPSGVFYSGNLFPLSIRDVFFPVRRDSRVQFEAFFKSLPLTDEDVRREFAFELMKLVYIRSAKLKRASVTYWAFSVWIASGGAIWIFHLFSKTYGS